MATAVRVEKEVYDKLIKHKQITYIPINKIIELSVNEYIDKYWRENGKKN